MLFVGFLLMKFCRDVQTSIFYLFDNYRSTYATKYIQFIGCRAIKKKDSDRNCIVCIEVPPSKLGVLATFTSQIEETWKHHTHSHTNFTVNM